VSRRARTLSIPCHHPGCTEHARFEYDNQRDAARIDRDHATWKCVRHAAGMANLAADNPTRTCVMVVIVFPHMPQHRFFRAEGAPSTSGSGFVYGPGFQAHAEDFPVGTRLTVTASVELPAVDQPSSTPGAGGMGGGDRG
jgi:hypothetical protein